MTEGIIQKVFNSYYTKKYSVYDYRSVLDLVKQELIEEIRKALNDPNSELYIPEDSIPALIGDTD